MTSRVLIDAVLDRPPVRLTSKAGKRYLRASARDGKGSDAKWWTVSFSAKLQSKRSKP
jgi:hypothetical protein